MTASCLETHSWTTSAASCYVFAYTSMGYAPTSRKPSCTCTWTRRTVTTLDSCGQPTPVIPTVSYLHIVLRLYPLGQFVLHLCWTPRCYSIYPSSPQIRLRTCWETCMWTTLSPVVTQRSQPWCTIPWPGQWCAVPISISEAGLRTAASWWNRQGRMGQQPNPVLWMF